MAEESLKRAGSIMLKSKCVSVKEKIQILKNISLRLAKAKWEKRNQFKEHPEKTDLKSIGFLL